MDESRIDIIQTPQPQYNDSAASSDVSSDVSSGPFSSPQMFPQMFPPGLFHLLPHGSENIESELLHLDRLCNFEELVKNMIGYTPKIRKWYARLKRGLSKSNTELGRMTLYSDEELGRMMARSGLLLLKFLRFLSDLPRSSKEFFQPKERQLSVQEAVIQIENQIPIYVLKKILEWERDADKDENRQADTDLDSILKHAWLKLSPIQYDSQVIARVPAKDDSHLLEFVYENIIGSSDFKHAYKWGKSKRRVHKITLPEAVQLRDKGVKFARNEGLLKTIRFENLTLYLPAIKMDGGTDALLRNLVLFEASKQEKRSQPLMSNLVLLSQPLMSYVDLMDRLIDTPEDVLALRDGGIIHNHLGSNHDVANVWNGMRRELPAEIIKYKPIDNAMDDVISFYTNKHRILLRRVSWIALIECILLALTVLQTLLSWEQVRLQLKSMNKT